MLIETGGTFGKQENMCKYIDYCTELAKKCIIDGEDKMKLLEILEAYINQYEKEINWKYYDSEMNFLNRLKLNIEHL